MKQNILWFQVPMHYILFGQHSKGFQNLFKINHRLFFIYLSFSGEHFGESATITKFIDEIEIINSFEHINITDYVGAFFIDFAQNTNLIDCEFLKLGYLMKFFNWNGFDGNFLPRFHIHSSVNMAIDTFP